MFPNSLKIVCDDGPGNNKPACIGPGNVRLQAIYWTNDGYCSDAEMYPQASMK